MTSVLIQFIGWQRGGRTLGIAHADWRRIGLRAVAEAEAAFVFPTALFNMPPRTPPPSCRRCR